MSTYCRLCGKPVEGEDEICKACKENVQAEATGKQRRIAKEASKGAGKSGVRGNVKEREEEQPPSASPDEEGEKRPHHFTSMAEYLDYLKGEK